MPEPIAFQGRFARAVHHLIALRQPGVLLSPLAAADLVRVLRVCVVTMPVRTVLYRAVVPKKQDAFRAELEGQFDRSKSAVVLAVGFVPIQVVL